MGAENRDVRGEFGRWRRLVIWGVAALLMLVPVLAIRGFSSAAWDLPGDLMFLAILLAGVCTAVEVAARVPQKWAYPAAAAMALVSAAAGAWINLAVGIIGSEDNPANWIFAGPIAIAGFGAALARFEAAGMSTAMIAAAVAQALVFLAAAAAGLGFTGPITVFFTALWLISAWLFRTARIEQLL